MLDTLDQFISLYLELSVTNIEKYLSVRFTPIDLLNASAQVDGDHIGNIAIITDKRNQIIDTMVYNRLSFLFWPVDSIGSVVLNSARYEEAFISRHPSGSHIYYSKEQGVVGFRTDRGEIYNLIGVIKNN